MVTASLLLIARRMLAHGWLLSAVVVGVILAVTVMASSVIYFESLRTLALERALASVPASQLDVLVQADALPVNRDTYRKVTDTMQGSIIERVSPFLSGYEESLKTWTFLMDDPPPQVLPGQCPCRTDRGPNQPGDDAEAGTIACDCRRMSFMSIPGMRENTVIVDGDFPEPSLAPVSEGTTYVVEVMVDKATADKLDLPVGSEMKGKIFWSDEHERVTARVTGIYVRADTANVLWRIYDDVFASRGGSLEFARYVVPDETILDGFSAYFPGMGAEVVFLLDIDASLITPSDARLINGTLETTANELKSVIDGFSMKTILPAVINTFETELFFNRLPMFIVLILIVLVVLYYVATLASLLVETQRSEVALLRSRGATSRQVLAVFVIESLFLSGVAVIIGPLIALAGVSVIGVLPVYADLNGGEPLPVRLTVDVFTLAAIGGGLSALALFVPAVRATRLGLLTDRRARARPPRLAFIQRYYLDLGGLGLVLFMFWQLTRQGSFVATSLFGEQTVNNLILAVPALFLVAAGVVVLRVFPVSMELAGRFLSSRHVSRVAPPALILSTWQMARNPSSHVRLSLLLILTAALGVFAASFASTLNRSETEQVLYNSGADLRATLVAVRASGRSFRLADELEEIPGVISATAVYRETGSATSRLGGDRFDFIAVDPGRFGEIAWTREDLTGGTLSDRLREVETGGQGGLLLPEETFWLSVRMRPLISQPDALLVARLSDSNNRYYTIILGRLLPEATDEARFRCPLPEPGEPPGWCRVGTRVAPQSVGRTRPLLFTPPVRLHSIGVVSFGHDTAPSAVDLDDITVLDGLGRPLGVIEDFNDITTWRTLEPTVQSLGDTLTRAVDDEGRETPGVARFRWTGARQREMRGIAIGRDEPVIPVLASPSFLETFSLEIGDTFVGDVGSARITTEIRGSIELFPTLHPDERPFLIADFDAFHELLNLALVLGEEQPTEYWMRTEAGVEIRAASEGYPLESAGPDPAASRVIRQLETLRVRSGNLVDRSALLAAVSVDPLVSAGWQALLGIAFLTVLIVSAIGFLVHARVSFNSRRSELALLRTMGLSMLQLLSLVMMEQLMVIGAAVGIGVFMGTRLGDTIIPFLANSGENRVLVPPMVLEFDWAGLGLTFGLLSVVLAAVIITILISVYRMSIHHVMRMGEG